MSTDAGPRATYRVQLNKDFGFDQAAAVSDYLTGLGVSHFYASPYLQAAPGSAHGYDVVDHRRVNRELGGAEAHARFCRKLAESGLGQVLDVVPNHMAIATQHNAWWWDVLENGPSSRYASYFDVDWEPCEARQKNRLLLPILGEHYGRVLEAGELKLERRGGSFVVRYYDHQMPAAPGSVHEILSSAAARSGSEVLAFLADALASLPPFTQRDRLSIHRRHRDKEAVRLLLSRLCEEEQRVAAAIDQLVAAVNSDPGALDSLLQRQHYRLAFWKVAASELGYRRFFDINNLIGLRVEEEEVMASTHGLILRWIEEGHLSGLRIDHPDGLRDPEEYLQRLRRRAPGAWVVVEKILEPGERLPETWPVAGTTGYDFLNLVGGLFVDPAGEAPLTRIYSDFTGETTDYQALIREKKLQVLRETLGSDVNRLTSLFMEVCERHPLYRDFTRNELRDVLLAVVACFPVYRTYVRAQVGQVSEDDIRHVSAAVEAARAFRPDLDRRILDFFRDLLLLRVKGDQEGELAMRSQQLTGPAMAKGVEDTAFYCFNRLVSLNEVGGDPSRFGCSADEFHRWSAEVLARRPLTMLATSTHDTKRSEDVRARLSLLSEIPERWETAVRRWSALNERHRKEGWPDRNAEYHFYQVLVGAWPLGAERAWAYLEKAAREAKVHTSWTDPRPAYEEHLRSFVEGALADGEFMQDVEAFVEPLVMPGRITSLAQTLLKLTAPGVPDIYQGSELWDLSLVDPDNRRPVDFALRRRLLSELRGARPEDIWARADEGLPKLHLTERALSLRRRRPHLFGPRGGYGALPVRGRRATHAVAFVRGGGAVTLVPRLVLGLSGDWMDTTVEIGDGQWRNELTGEGLRGGRLRLADALARFPVALLSSKDA